MSDKYHKSISPNPYEQQFTTADITMAVRGRISDAAVRGFTKIHEAVYRQDPSGTLEMMGIKLSPAVQETIQDLNAQTTNPDNVVPINVKEASRAAQDAAVSGDEMSGFLDNGKIPA